MNKKKVFLTVLLSVLLAFLISIYLHEVTRKPKHINEQQVEEIKIQEQNSIDTINSNKESLDVKKTASSEKKKLATTSKPVVKEKENVLQKHDELTTNTENSSKIVEDNKEVNELNQENGVIVPVNYVSKNIYKYTYTPKRYPKQKL